MCASLQRQALEKGREQCITDLGLKQFTIKSECQDLCICDD